MIKRFNNQPNKYYKINERIFASQLRVIDAEGKQIGVLNKVDALNKAREEGLDLVLIAENATPPVAKIIDFNKFLYQESKRKQEEKKKAKTTDTKEVRLGPFMGENDLQTMLSRARGFLEDGNKVRFVVKFRGREITKSKFGFDLLNKVFENLSDISKIDREPKLEGKQMFAIISPERKNKNAKIEEKN